MNPAPKENAQAFWEDFAAGRESSSDAATAGLALYGSCPIYDAYRHRAECIAVGSLLPSPSAAWRVLDVGCGPGRWTVPFARSCAEVVAVDFSENMLAHAAKRCEESGVAGKVVLRQQRLEELDATALGKPFDLLLLMGVLQFVPVVDLPSVVERLARCVAPGGFLLHRETRSPKLWEKDYGGREVTMKSFYKPFEVYRDAFAQHGFAARARRSIIPPSLLYSLYSRVFKSGTDAPMNGLPLKMILGLHEILIDPLWRCVPEVLWRFNSRRATDQSAVLYSKA